MDDGIVDKATAAIQDADLTPTEHLILLDFVKEAYEPSLTARVVLDRIRDTDGPVEETLRILKEDWHELVSVISRPTPLDASFKDLLARRGPYRCCVSPPDCQQLDEPEPTFIIPPALADLVEVKEADLSSKSLLDAFMTPSRAARLKSMVSDRTDQGRLANALFLAPSIQHAFKNGHLQVRLYSAKSWDSLDGDACEDDLKAKYIVFGIGPEHNEDILLADRTPFRGRSRINKIDLQTEDPKQLPLPSPFLLKTHFLFAIALNKFYVEDRITEGWGPLESPSLFSWGTQRIARFIWLLVPKFIRVAYYHRIIAKRVEIYGINFPNYNYQLPLGFDARCSNRLHFNEPDALLLVERSAPSIRAPRLIDTFHYASRDWVITTRLPGRPIVEVLHRMSHPERNQLVADLSNIIAQMHKIPNTTPYRFANVTGGPVYDHRIDSWGVGPFNNEADLNKYMVGGDEPNGEYYRGRLMEDLPTAFSRTHDSVFTHGNLSYDNVLVDGGRLSGISDWEGAAFMPRYWECAKVMRPTRFELMMDIYRKLWGDEFEIELETEKWLRQIYPFGGGGVVGGVLRERN